MTIIHMETDTVSIFSQQMIQSVEEMQGALLSLKLRALGMDWMGDNQAEFSQDLESVLESLYNQLNSAQYLAERVIREVEEWESIAATFDSAGSVLGLSFLDILDRGMDILPYVAALPFIKAGNAYGGQTLVFGGRFQKWLTYGGSTLSHIKDTKLLNVLNQSPLNTALLVASIGLISWEARQDYGKYGKDHVDTAFAVNVAEFFAINAVASKAAKAGAVVGSGLGPVGSVGGAAIAYFGTSWALHYMTEEPLESLVPNAAGAVITFSPMVWGVTTPFVKNFVVNETSNWMKMQDFGSQSIKDLVIHSVADCF